jgi:hypothetical protein
MRRDLIGIAAIGFMVVTSSALAADQTPGVDNPAVATSPGEESKGKPDIPASSSAAETGAQAAPDATATSPGEENKGKAPIPPQ